MGTMRRSRVGSGVPFVAMALVGLAIGACGQAKSGQAAGSRTGAPGLDLSAAGFNVTIQAPEGAVAKKADTDVEVEKLPHFSMLIAEGKTNISGTKAFLSGAYKQVAYPVDTPDTIVYEASSGDRSVAFKAVEPEGRDADGIAAETWACERADKAGVPAPAVLEVDTSHSKFPSSFFVVPASSRSVPASRSRWRRSSVSTSLWVRHPKAYSIAAATWRSGRRCRRTASY